MSLVLPTMEALENPELAALGKKYRKAVDTRLKALGVELPLKQQVIDKMHELKITHYKDEDVEIELKQSEKVKVKLDGDEDE
jgi:hypothetical protein